MINTMYRQCPEIDPNIYGQLIFSKGNSVEKDNLFNERYRTTRYPYEKNIEQNIDPYLTAYIKLTQNVIIYLKPKTKQIQKETQENIL